MPHRPPLCGKQGRTKAAINVADDEDDNDDDDDDAEDDDDVHDDAR